LGPTRYENLGIIYCKKEKPTFILLGAINALQEHARSFSMFQILFRSMHDWNHVDTAL
jgi:hypothetical protein